MEKVRKRLKETQCRSANGKSPVNPVNPSPARTRKNRWVASDDNMRAIMAVAVANKHLYGMVSKRRFYQICVNEYEQLTRRPGPVGDSLKKTCEHALRDAKKKLEAIEEGAMRAEDLSAKDRTALELYDVVSQYEAVMSGIPSPRPTAVDAVADAAAAAAAAAAASEATEAAEAGEASHAWEESGSGSNTGGPNAVGPTGNGRPGPSTAAIIAANMSTGGTTLYSAIERLCAVMTANTEKQNEMITSNQNSRTQWETHLIERVEQLEQANKALTETVKSLEARLDRPAGRK